MAAALVRLPLLAACRAVHPDGGGVQGAAVCAAIYMCEHAAEGCSYPSDTCVTTLRVVAGMAVLSLAHLQHGVSLVFFRCFFGVSCPGVHGTVPTRYSVRVARGLCVEPASCSLARLDSVHAMSRLL